MLEEEKPDSQVEDAEANFAPDMIGEDDDTIETEQDSINWVGPEFIASEKPGGWYAGLLVVTLVFAALLFLLTGSIITVAAVIVGGLMVGVYGAREPRQLEYRLGASSLSVGNRHFSYENFRAFSIIKDNGIASIDFMPLKRFSPILTVYFHPDDEQVIAKLLSNRLPYQDRNPDAIERLMRRLHF
ncbi:MAG TPA: hypothetical protein VG604_03645 [Candidatus Saccharimonadales bacterium]|nr:hypothetical protein [Candidatus Saccharimonadales bacterium]